MIFFSFSLRLEITFETVGKSAHVSIFSNRQFKESLKKRVHEKSHNLKTIKAYLFTYIVLFIDWQDVLLFQKH